MSACLHAQSLRNPLSAIYLQLGAYSNDHIDVFSVHANQAALAKLDQKSAGLYSERRFLLKELSFYNATAAITTPSGNFGLDARYFGFTGFNESQLGLAYARSLGSKLDIGVQFNYYSVRVPGYGNASTIIFDIGAILHLTDKLNSGVHVHNPLGGKLGKNGEEKLTSIYTVGLGYNASEIFFLSAEIVKQEDQAINVNAGLQYKFLSRLLARAGISSATSSWYLGAGFQLRSFRLDVTATHHQQLGLTPGLLLILTLSPKGESKKE